MKSIVKSVTAILLTFSVICAFAACESDKGNDTSDSSSYGSTVSENSAAESTDNFSSEEPSEAMTETDSKLLLYKECHNPGTEWEYTVIYEYTDFGEIATSMTTFDTGDLSATTKYEYNEDRKLISVATYQYEEVTEKTKYEYNDSGLLVKKTKVIDTDTNETVYTYDKDNRLIGEELIGFHKSSYTYNEDGSYTIDSFFTDGSKRSQTKYDKNGLLLEEIAEGSRVVCTYNDKGDILSYVAYNDMEMITSKEIYTYDGQTVVKESYDYDEIVFTVKSYYDDENNLIKVARIDESGNETVVEEREYKLFDIVK